MASFERQVRRVSVIADVAFLGAVAIAVGARLASGHGWMPSVLLVGFTFGYMVAGHIARLLLRADGETRRGVAHAIVWVANAVIVLPLWVYLAAPSFSGGMSDPEPSTWLGVPMTIWLLGLGIGMLVLGRYWIHRLLHEGREPESNDRFWWSRA